MKQYKPLANGKTMWLRKNKARNVGQFATVVHSSNPNRPVVVTTKGGIVRTFQVPRARLVALDSKIAGLEMTDDDRKLLRGNAPAQ